MAKDPRLSIGANGGPPLDEAPAKPPTRVMDPALVRLAHLGCKMVALLMEEQDPAKVLIKRQGGRALITRKVWLYAMQRFVPQWMLAQMTGLDRGTVAQDQRDVAVWMENKGLIRSLVEAVIDATEVLPAFVEDGAEFVEECLLELSVKRVRAAAALLEESAPPPPAVVTLIREGRLTPQRACALYGVKPAQVERWVRMSV